MHTMPNITTTFQKEVRCVFGNVARRTAWILGLKKAREITTECYVTASKLEEEAIVSTGEGAEELRGGTTCEVASVARVRRDFEVFV